MKTGVFRTLLCALLALCSSCVSPPDASPVFPGAGWEQASPESQGIDSGKLVAAIEKLESNTGGDGVKELVIVRHGRLLWSGSDVDKVHGVWSVTKAFTTLCLGLLIDDGEVTLDTPAHEIIPEMAKSYPDVTMRHFASMTSGYRAVGDEPRGSYLHGPSVTPFEPNAMPLFAPGEKYAYWDSAMNQFGNILTRIAGEPLADLFERRMAGPIGMKNWEWGDFGEVDGIRVNGGAGNNGHHVKISSRELARLGSLFLNGGNWNGQQLISAEFVAESVKVQVPSTLPLGHPESGIDGRGVYGFNWWANGVKDNGELLWPDAPPGTYSRSGHNNNDLYVIPEWNMVIVRLGLDQADVEITDESYSHFLGMIGDAILE